MRKLLYFFLTIYCLSSCDKNDNVKDEKSQAITGKVINGEIGLSNAYVWLIPTNKGDIELAITDIEGKYIFSNVEAEEEYKIFVYKDGFQSKVDVKREPHSYEQSPIPMTPFLKKAIRFKKTIIDMGATGNSAIVDIETDDQNLSWEIKIDPACKWLKLDTTAGKGNNSVIITLHRDILYKNSQKYVPIYIRTSDGQSDELYVIVSGAGKGINLGDIITYAAKNINITSAIIPCIILNDELIIDAKQIGICYSSTNKNPLPNEGNFIEKIDLSSIAEDGSFSVSLILESGQMYYARAYVLKKDGTYHTGNVIEFTAASIPPSVRMINIEDPSSNSAIFIAEITHEGAPKYTKRGFVYSTSENPTLETAKKIDPTQNETAKYFVTATGLPANTPHYVRAYVTNSNITVYSNNEIPFTTSKIQPELKVFDATNKGVNSATLNGMVVYEGVPAYLERGFCYIPVSYCNSFSTPYISDNRIPITGNDFTCEITGLDYKTTYKVRAYAIQSGEEIYSENVICFSTIWEDAEIITSPITTYDTTTATFEGHINNVGTPPYSEIGFCFLPVNSTVYYNIPDISDNSRPAQNIESNHFAVNISDLESGQSYIVRTYAKQGKEVIYGDYKIFTTKKEDYITIGNLGIQKTDYSSASVNYSVAYNNCNSSNIGNLTNWRLPTIEELRMIYQHRNQIGGFAQKKTVDYIYTDFPAYWSSTVGEQPNTHYVKFFESSADETIFRDDWSDYTWGNPDYEIWSMHTRCVCTLP
jgi:hypothetical protein